MKKRDLFNLPENEVFNLTDRICNYNYTLVKTLRSDGGGYMYRITCQDTRQHLTLFDNYLGDDDDDCERDDYGNKIIVRSLSVMCGCGGLHVHSDDYWRCLSVLKLLPRGSLKNFFEKTRI